jgi:hypothetical protein
MPDVSMVPLADLVERHEISHLRQVDMLAAAILRISPRAWMPVLLGGHSTWLIPARRRKRDALAVLSAVLKGLAVGGAQACELPPAIAGVNDEMLDQLDVAAKDIRFEFYLEGSLRFAATQTELPLSALLRIASVRASWYTRDVAVALMEIAFDERVSPQTVFDIWAHLHNRAVDEETPIIVEFDSGEQVRLDERFDDAVDDLLDILEAEATADLGRYWVEELGKAKPPDWPDRFTIIFEQWTKTVERCVQQAMTPLIAQHVLQTLLMRELRERLFSSLRRDYPHLAATPERMAEAISTAKRGSVVVLGKDSGPSLDRLEQIGTILEEEYGLSPILIREQPVLEEHGLVGKLLAYTTMARYVIVENSEPSGHLYELPYLHTAEVLLAVLQEHGKGASRMPDDSLAKNPLARVFRYDVTSLADAVGEAVAWAEQRLHENAKANREVWPWLDEQEAVSATAEEEPRHAQAKSKLVKSLREADERAQREIHDHLAAKRRGLRTPSG